MSEDVLTDDQSHYEVSLTAGQAFLAFVLLLLSLAAAFAFGLLIGRGQAEEKVTARKDATVVNESPASKPAQREVAVKDDDFKEPETADAKIMEEAGGGQTPSPVPAARVQPKSVQPAASQPSPSNAAEGGGAPQSGAQMGSMANHGSSPVSPAVSVAGVPFYAQLVSTSDQKTAESLAAKLIDAGFTSSYVERGTSPKGPVFRVRVKFPSEAAAHAAEAKLKTFSPDVWITK